MNVIQHVEVQANGFTFRVRTAGDRHRPAVILLHGFPETAFMWERLMPVLAEAGYFVIAPDQRGYSPLARPVGVEHYQIDKLVHDVLAIARELGVRRFHLVGHDSGGSVSWRLAAFYPQKVISLTALSASHLEAFAGGKDSPDQRQFTSFIREPGLVEVAWAANDYRLLRALWSEFSAEQQENYLETYRQDGALTATANFFRALAHDYFDGDDRTTSSTPRVSRPTLVLCGTRDPQVTAWELEANREHVIGPFESVKLDAGHWIVEQAHEGVKEHLLAHLQKFGAGEASDGLPVPDERQDFATIVQTLEWRAKRNENDIAFTYLADGEKKEESITYGVLADRVKVVAGHLQAQGLEGERVLLLYPSGLEYIIAFLACLYARLVAVPAYPPDPTRLNRTLPRLEAICTDAKVAAILTFTGLHRFSGSLIKRARVLEGLKWLDTQALVKKKPGQAWRDPEVGPDDLAFLQYTSGSTSDPKGVMLSHRNLMHHLALNQNVSEIYEGAPTVSWVPLYHDLGLIACVLGTVYSGSRLVFMSPIAFLQRPMRWLEAISRYRAVATAAPNFAYELCARKATAAEVARLDLRSLIMASNGAEPIAAGTLEAFCDTFRSCGFRRELFRPGYGLAEATATVTGAKIEAAPALVLSLAKEVLKEGRVKLVKKAGGDALHYVGLGDVVRVTGSEQLRIVDVESRVECPPLVVGEIWVSSPSVAMGYWNRPEETQQTFAGYIEETGEGPFLRTGDLGFVYEAQLFVTTRLKDLLIINGANFHPQDIEQTVQSAHPDLRPGCTIAFNVDGTTSEELVVVAEVVDPEEKLTRGNSWALGKVNVLKARVFDAESLTVKADEILDAIKEAVSKDHGLACHNIVLIKARTIPKTSSGKVQRRQCRQEYLAGELAIVARNRPGAVAQEQLARLPDDTFFTDRWDDRVQSRLTTEGMVFPLELSTPYTVFHMVGHDANALVHDPVKVDRGAHFGPTPFPQNFAVAAAGSVFSNGEKHDRLKRWTMRHVMRTSGSLSVQDFGNLIHSHVRRWSARSVSFRWNDDLAALACEMAVLLMTGKTWAGATKHIDTFGMECLTLDVRGRTVDVNKLLPSYNPMWDFFRSSGLQDEEGVLDADTIYGQVMGALCFAAYPSNVHTMSCWLGELALSPELTQRLCDEVDANWDEIEKWLATNPSVLEASMGGFFDRLPLLTGSISETLRLHPSVTHVSGYARAPVTVGGVDIPERAHVIMDILHSMRLSDAALGEIPPTTFAPQRHLGRVGRLPPSIDGLLWGLGDGESGRRCPASHISPVLLTLFACVLLREAKWSVEEPKPWRHDHYFWPSWSAYGTGLPVSPIALREHAKPLPLRGCSSAHTVVVGGGVAGMRAAMALARSGFAVTLIEKGDTLGGHASNKKVLGGEFERDAAFGVFQANQWPNLLALLDELEVPKISLGVSDTWTENPFWGWFARDGHTIPLQKGEAEGERFIKDMSEVLADAGMDGVSVAEYLQKYEAESSREFLLYFFLGRIIHYFAGQSLQYYLAYPVRLIAWMVVNNPQGQSTEVFRVQNKQYVQAFESKLRELGVAIIKGAETVRVGSREADGVELTYSLAESPAQTRTLRAGHLILAVLPHIARRILGDAVDAQESEILHGFEHTDDTVVVHQDASWLPEAAKRRVFNYLLPDEGVALPSAADTVPGTSIGHCTRDLKTPIFATYDYALASQPAGEGSASPWAGPVSRITFSHARVTPATQCQRRALSSIQGQRSTHYCGSWSRGLTFHEDALVSGLQAANRVMADYGIKSQPQVDILDAKIPLPEPFEAMPTAESAAKSRRSGGEVRRKLTPQSHKDLQEIVMSQVARYVLPEEQQLIDPEASLVELGLSSMQTVSLAGIVSDYLPQELQSREATIELMNAPNLRAMVDELWRRIDGGGTALAQPDVTSGTVGPVRLLCLHGFRSNARVMSTQVDHFFRGFSSQELDVTMLEATRDASGFAGNDLAGAFDGPFYEWFGVASSNEVASPLTLEDLNALKDADGMEVHGLEESLAHVAGALRDAELAGRAYDGILGFSQGGYLVHRVAALAASGDVRFRNTFRFAMMVGKHPGLAESLFSYPTGVVALPSCHVFSDNEADGYLDYLVHYVAEQRLIIRHKQGHVFPVLDAEQTEALRGFLQRHSASSDARMQVGGHVPIPLEHV